MSYGFVAAAADQCFVCLPCVHHAMWHGKSIGCAHRRICYCCFAVLATCLCSVGVSEMIPSALGIARWQQQCGPQ